MRANFHATTLLKLVNMFYIVLLHLLNFFAGEFVVVESFYGFGCEEESYISSWIFPLPSYCTLIPFNAFGRFRVGDTNNTVNFTVYDSPQCTSVEKGHHLSVNFLLSKCYPEVKDHLSFKLSKVSELPFDRESSGKYFSIDIYKGYDCSDPSDILDFYRYKISTNESRVLLPSLYENCTDINVYHTLFYCTGDWFAEEVFLCQYAEVIGWRYYPQAKDGKCLRYQNYTSGILVNPEFPIYPILQSNVFPPSFKKFCPTRQEFETNFIDVKPKQSLGNFVVLSFTFEEDCRKGTEFYRSLSKFDTCIRGEITTTASSDKIIVFSYLDAECTSHSLYRVQISRKPNWVDSFVDTCFYYNEDLIHYKWYFMVEFVEYIEFPDQVSRIITDRKCGESLDDLKKNLNFYDLFSITNDHCLNKYIFPEIRSIGKGTKSLLLRCNEGKLRGKNYTEGAICYGSNRLVEVGDVCYKVNDGYHHVTCIPKYCSSISEFDPNVCNSFGECRYFSGEMTPRCDCKHDYRGDNCQDFECFGIDRLDPSVCSHKSGSCVAPDVCSCKKNYSGEKCQVDEFVIAFFSSFSIVSSFAFGGCIIFSFCCCLLLQLVCFTCCGCLVGITSIAILQWNRLRKYLRLRDIDLLLREQLLEEDDSIAHLKINTTLFEIPYNEIKIRKIIGTGGSSSVVFFSSWKGRQCAFKCFKTKEFCSSQDKFDEFEKEVNLLANVNHPNIIRFFGASMKPPRVGIVMEYCENGEILNFVILMRERNHGKGYTEKNRMFLEICSACEYLHSRSIIHRDLKCENVLVDKSHHTKLMDFGISKMVERKNSSEGKQKTKRLGTNYFMAPEIITGYYNEKIDVFSFSILVYMILSESVNPYEDIAEEYQIEFRVANDPNFRPDLQKLENIVRSEQQKKNVNGQEGLERDDDGRPDGIGQEWWLGKVLEICWSHDYKERYGFQQLQEIFEKEEFIPAHSVVDRVGEIGSVQEV